MGVRVIESAKQIINRNKEMDEEGMQVYAHFTSRAARDID